MHDRNMLKSKAMKSNDRKLMTECEIVNQRNLVNSEIRLAKQNYYLGNFNKCRSRWLETHGRLSMKLPRINLERNRERL